MLNFYTFKSFLTNNKRKFFSQKVYNSSCSYSSYKILINFRNFQLKILHNFTSSFMGGSTITIPSTEQMQLSLSRNWPLPVQELMRDSEQLHLQVLSSHSLLSLHSDCSFRQRHSHVVVSSFLCVGHFFQHPDNM